MRKIILLIILSFVNIFPLNAQDGTIDPTFNQIGIGFSGTVYCITLQNDGKIFVGGKFDLFNGLKCPSGIIRLNKDGTLDNTFNPEGKGFSNDSFDTVVYCINVQNDGKILVGGNFHYYNDSLCSYGLIRLNNDGKIDHSFNDKGYGFDNGNYMTDILTILIQNDEKLLIGGSFNRYNDKDCPSGLIRLDRDGKIDTTFNYNGKGFYCCAKTLDLQIDGKIIAGGAYFTYNCTWVPSCLIRINIDGSLDTTFNYNGGGFFDSTMWVTNCVVILNDGKILVGGRFSKYDTTDCSTSLVKINSDGTIDSTFNYNGVGFSKYFSMYYDSEVYKLALQKDSKIIVCGSFSKYNDSLCSQSLIRLNPDGSYDNSFNFAGAGINDTKGIAYTVCIQDDWKILVGGTFGNYNNLQCLGNLIRLNNSELTNIDDELTFKTSNITISPNPAINEIGINFTIEEKCFAQIFIYSQLGELVANISDTGIGDGSHSVNFNTSHLPPGVYFCQIKAGSYIETKKFVMVK
ncbi:MAG: T9SS type A sorting domain-containing protein [FCB group bacterium]|jgi:uncharacterized delta-60 repeat protein